mgnify:CR=1 FL=1
MRVVESQPATVALARCTSYAAAEVEDRLAYLLDALGGIERFVSRGQRVLVKPNLITDTAPQQAKTTHPEVVRALLRLLRHTGCEPFVADGPASVLKLERVWTATGMAAVCAEEGVPLVNLEQGGSETVERDGISFTVARRVLEADAVINVPKVKTHVLTGFTGAVKNLYGCIPGLQKAGLHKRYFKTSQFARLLTYLYERVRPVLSVADGIVGMHGNGPTSGDPIDLGLLAASGDGVALDATLCRLVGLPLSAVPCFKPLAAAGAGCVGAEDIRIAGDSPDDLEPVAFRPPNTVSMWALPQFLVDLVRPFIWIRPTFSERCISCGLCVKSCPVGALSLEPGQRPVLDRRTCIECCCCHEVCPQKAVDMQLSTLQRLMSRRQQALRV